MPRLGASGRVGGSVCVRGQWGPGARGNSNELGASQSIISSSPSGFRLLCLACSRGADNHQSHGWSQSRCRILLILNRNPTLLTKQAQRAPSPTQAPERGGLFTARSSGPCRQRQVHHLALALHSRRTSPKRAARRYHHRHQRGRRDLQRHAPLAQL